MENINTITMNKNTTSQELKNAMMDTWNNNGFNDIKVITTNKDEVIVTPCCSTDVKSLDEVEYYLTYGGCDPYIGGEDLDKLVDKFINYTALANEAESEKTKVAKYFEKHIKGHTQTELEIGYACYDQAWEHAKGYTSISEVLEDAAFVTEMAKNLDKTEDEIRAGIALVGATSFYSDWHKDCYGYRPRYQLAS